ncbi:MAG: amidohydrolase family protein, partial [Spirochaetaceae bacterium]|nr:amidohydrolase family protein [Spirochaetaceae bacterium]
MRTIIQGGTIITAGDTIKTDVLIEDGIITRVGNLGGEIRSGDEVIDAKGLLVMPGGVDPHTHLEMPFGGTVSSDDFFTGHRAAAFGGTTTHIDFALQAKGETLVQGINTWKARAKDKAAIDYGFHIAVTDPTDETIAEIPSIANEGVSSLKV